MQNSFRHIRNATGVLQYGGKTFLIDPMLAAKDAYPGFPGSARSELRNPLVDLPLSLEELFKGVDCVVATHLHPDHWDEKANEVVPKDLPIFAQHEADAAMLTKAGFVNVRVMQEADNEFEGVFFDKAPCQHGSDELYAVPPLSEAMGEVSGLIFKKDGAPKVYFISDTIWYAGVESTLQSQKPDVVVVNAGEATMDNFGNIIIGREDIVRIHKMLPDTRIIAVHMEAINHCLLTRKDLAAYAKEHGAAAKLAIPADGEVVTL